MNGEAIVQKIAVTYSDGATDELDKGIVVRFESGEEPDEQKITLEMLSISRAELLDFVAAIVDFLDKQL